MSVSQLFKWGLVGFMAFRLNAQEDKLMDQLKEDEKKVVEAIALYPEKERLDILEVSKHPEVLVRLQRMQMKTAADFQEMISPLSDYDQKQLYNLSRYPTVLMELSEGNRRKSAKQLDEIFQGYPDELKQQAAELQKDHYDIITKVNYLYITSEQSFQDIIKTYPKETQSAYRDLMKLPEVISILTDNMNLTVLLGDLYNSHPDQLKAELDALNIVVAEQKAKELKEWQESMENDPQAMAEYEQAAKEFADEQGYSATDYNQNRPDNYTTDIYVHHIWQPYPYWFGCPWWYPYNCWYPYPWWYHWGYYYGPGNVIVFVGMPSTYFMYWNFYSNPSHHFYHYPHFTNHLISYHDHHRHSINSVTGIVDSWERDNRNKLPREFLNDDQGRAGRIQELGRFDIDYDIASSQSGGKVLTQREFLQDHANDYPSLKPLLKERPETNNEPGVRVNQPVQRQPEQQRQPVEGQRSRVIQPQTNQQEIERAKTHHERTWETTRPPQQRTPVSRPPVQQRTPVQQRPPVQRTPVQRPPTTPAPRSRVKG